MKIINIDALESAGVEQNPYPYTIIPNFLNKEYLPDIHQDYPAVQQAGSYPLSSVHYGSHFDQLVKELQSDELRQVIAEKFKLDLSDKPVLITVRGHADNKDGKIHTDSKTKIITLLLYMNEDWQPDEGRLRLLYDNSDLDNYAVEVPPQAGNVVIFKVTPNGWHGHKPIIGARRVIQLNYISDESALKKHQVRHRFSAKFKQWARKFGIGGY